MHLNHYKGHWNIQYMCNWGTFMYPASGNMFEYFASWRVSASSRSIDQCVCIFCCPCVILKPTAAAKLSCMMLSRCPSTVAALICHHTSSSASVHIHIEKHTFSIYQCLHTYFLWAFFVSHTHIHTLTHLPRAQRLFPHRVKCNGNFRECTCILNVCMTRTCPH